jgi:hypothetical protein
MSQLAAQSSTTRHSLTSDQIPTLQYYLQSVNQHLIAHKNPDLQEKLTEPPYQDFSCLRCYPVDYRSTAEFIRFWAWYRKETGAISYTSVTQDALVTLCSSSIYSSAYGHARNQLLLSCYYQPDLNLQFTTVFENLQRQIQETGGFQCEPIQTLTDEQELFDESSESQLNSNPDQSLAQQPDSTSLDNFISFEQETSSSPKQSSLENQPAPRPFNKQVVKRYLESLPDLQEAPSSSVYNAQPTAETEYSGFDPAAEEYTIKPIYWQSNFEEETQNLTDFPRIRSVLNRYEQLENMSNKGRQSNDGDGESQRGGEEDTNRRLTNNDDGDCEGERPPVRQIQRPPVTLEDRLAETARIVQQMATALTERQRDNERSIAKVEPFYGEGQDSENWLEEFEKARIANRWTEERALAIIPVYLKGNAAAWFNNGHFHTYRLFVRDFRDYFRTSARIMTWRMELDTRFQRDNESIETYAAALRELFRKIPINDVQEQIRHFIKGIKMEYTSALCSEELATLNAAVNKARRLETSTAYQRIRKAMVGDTEQDKTLAALQTQIAALRADFQQKPQVQFERRNDNETVRNTQRNARPAFKGNCYNCGKEGHQKKDCRSGNNNGNNRRPNFNQQRNNNGLQGGYSNMPYQNNNQYPPQNFNNQYQPNQWQNQGPPPPMNYRNDARYQPVYSNYQPVYDNLPRYNNNSNDARNYQPNNRQPNWYYNQQEQPPRDQPHYRNEPNDDDLRQRLHDLLNLKD